MTAARTLTALRIVSTVLMCFAIAQAGLAAGFLGGKHVLELVHGFNALALLLLTLGLLLTAILHLRATGQRWPAIGAIILLAAGIGQILLAVGDVVGLHIFCGVLYVVLATLLTSYLFRPGFVPPIPGRAVRG